MRSSAISRRSWLKTAGVAAIGAGLGAGCAPRTSRKLAKVEVSRRRVIRTVVGLRPFRPSGFVVKSEMLDQKTVIHNYGHGGGGVTIVLGQLSSGGGRSTQIRPELICRHRVRRLGSIYSSAAAKARLGGYDLRQGSPAQHDLQRGLRFVVSSGKCGSQPANAGVDGSVHASGSVVLSIFSRSRGGLLRYSLARELHALG